MLGAYKERLYAFLISGFPCPETPHCGIGELHEEHLDLCWYAASRQSV